MALYCLACPVAISRLLQHEKANKLTSVTVVCAEGLYPQPAHLQHVSWSHGSMEAGFLQNPVHKSSAGTPTEPKYFSCEIRARFAYLT